MDTWDLIRNWDLILPPSRPSASQLTRIKSALANVDRSMPVAVLGSTPEFRDLLFECGFTSIHVLERNLNSFAAMSAMRVHENQETLIQGDWLNTLPLFGDTFGVILSDLTSGNVPYQSRAAFYSALTNSLIRNGIFCDKVLTHPVEHIPLAALLQKYENLPLNLFHINHFSCEVFFCSDLLEIKRLVDSSLFYSILDRDCKSRRIAAFARETRRLTPPECIWWYGERWELLEGDYCPMLRLRSCDEDEASSPYYGRLRYFTLVKE